MLKKIELTNFRNYESRCFDFVQHTVFIGENGIGKTNILEAISYLALGRSFRTRQDKDVIRWGEGVARLVGETSATNLEIAVATEPRATKLIKVNGTSKRAIELLGHLTVVLFLPESLSLIDGPPQTRRQFLDLLLIQNDRRYAYHLLQLQKVLRQRNRLLRQIDEGEASADQLEFWDQSLIEHGSYLLVQRVEALTALNTTLAKHYETMSQKEGRLFLEYKAAAASESGGEQQKYHNPANCPTKKEDWAKILEETIKKYQYREVAAGSSLYGPQRDDFVFMLNDRPLSTFGSRGEYRSAVLALKAAEADFLIKNFEARDETIPLVFLLDDVYSELDEGRRGQLAQLIGDHQAVITTTDLSHLDEGLLKSAKVETLTLDK
jgi:DNA replication and repair protein RecF